MTPPSPRFRKFRPHGVRRLRPAAVRGLCAGLGLAALASGGPVADAPPDAPADAPPNAPAGARPGGTADAAVGAPPDAAPAAPRAALRDTVDLCGGAPEATGREGEAAPSDGRPGRRHPRSALRPSRDLYCMELVPTPRALEAARRRSGGSGGGAGIEEASGGEPSPEREAGDAGGAAAVEGRVELLPASSPFGTAVTPDGRQRYAPTLTAKGLPEPEALGEYTAYVAWVTTPLLHPVERLGEVGNGSTRLPPIARDKFLVLVSAEASAEAERRRGPLVLRGQSPSTRMRPADFLEFGMGAVREEEAGAERDDAAWPLPPMPAGITTLPAIGRLRPEVRPFLPGGDGGTDRVGVPSVAGGPADLPEARPREIVRLGDGDSLRLEAGVVRRTVRGRTFAMYGFNGQYPGPLLEVPRASTVTVEFRNRIGLPTTVHWHGIRIANRFDGAPGVTQRPVRPGETFTYRVRFPDAGIYWYHPHVREDLQQDLGLYGNMLVRPGRSDYYGPVDREEVLMLDDLLLGEEGPIPHGAERATHALMGRFGNLLLVNGEPGYRLEVGAGEVVRFFLTNVSNTRVLNLSFEGARVKVVGSDVGNFEREEWVESVVISPAERYVIHARFREAGEFAILNRVRGIDHVYGRFFPETDTLGLVRVRADDEETAEVEEAADVEASSIDAGRAAAAEDPGREFDRLRTHEPVVREIDRFRAEFDRPVDHELLLTLETRELPFVARRLMQVDSAYFHPVEWSGTMPMMNWAATPREARWVLRDPATGRENMEIDWRFRIGEVVKLRIGNDRNALHAMQHPIHIHGQRFLVLSRNGVPSDNLVWKDTVLLPVGETAEILLELTNPGEWMLHCHIAEHIEAGMKMVFTVEGEDFLEEEGMTGQKQRGADR